MHIHQIAPEDCRKALQHAGFGRLGCACENQPYVVPIHFCVDGDYAYSFSMPGQKLEWMRKNPLVCLEIDHVTGRDEWTSVVATGRYEELPDTPEFQADRIRALELFQECGMWWQPGSVPIESEVHIAAVAPTVFRVVVERLTGRRGQPSADSTIPVPTGSCLGRLFHRNGSRPQ